MKRKDWWYWLRFAVWFAIFVYLAVVVTLGTIVVVDVLEGKASL